MIQCTICKECLHDISKNINAVLELYIEICDFYAATGMPFAEFPDEISLENMRILENHGAIVSTELLDDPGMILSYPKGLSIHGFCFKKHHMDTRL